MGCSFCNPAKEAEDEVPKPKEYSWDKKPRVNPNDFIISNLKGEDVCRLPDSVNGQQLVIQNCSNSMIFVLDHIDSINIDDCTHCKIVLGPVKGSVFLRDSSHCVLVVPCGQFRMRDCHHLDTFLHCATQPIIESSSHIRFACISLQYDRLKEHMEMAGLSSFNNLWSSVHDFTPVDGDGNWHLLPSKIRLQEYITPPFPPQLRNAGWSVSADSKVIPHSLGTSDLNNGVISFLLIFGDDENQQSEIALNFLSTLLSLNDKCDLITSREVHLQSVDAPAMGLGPNEEGRLENGPVVGLIIGGPNCTESCIQVLEQLNLLDKVFMSPNHSIASKQASSFLQCAAVHRGC